MSWRRFFLTNLDRRVWKTGQRFLLHRYFSTSYTGFLSGAGSSILTPTSSKKCLQDNLNIFYSPLVWQRHLSTGVNQEGGESNDPRWYDVDTPEFVQIVKHHKKSDGKRLIIDVREPEELTESGSIPGTVNIPRKDN